ncbi:lichenan operon transcriptional antiterminator [Virgibacillus natechei]|uniref:Lichenan operon transcriptional antiterminator n=2 Tax=Virgibacillus natechei TaxID=1216297 RepID=A0ABS4IE54_9BACI|nr:lichenan operon transcriptional antiterminator [Virgibacillus natechei]
MRTILGELMAEQAPLTGKYLGNINKVTSRTTREDVKRVNELLSENGATIDTVMGHGYQLAIHDDQKFRTFLKSVFKEEVTSASMIPKSPEDRIAYVIKRLLLSEGFVKLDDLADEVYVSRSTIQNDLKQVKHILSEYDIGLESLPNYGLKVKGSELKLRFCMAEYIFDREDEASQRLTETHLSTLGQKELDFILAIIMKQVKENEITLSDIAINNLLIHIGIAYKRIKSGYHVTLYQTDLKQITDQKEYEVAKKIVQEVENTFHVAFPQAEIAYIAIHLLGTKLLSKANATDEIVEAMDDDIYQLVMLALDKVEQEFNLGIKQDKELIIGLGLHLKPAINRYRYGMNVRNPMLQDIKKNYPLAFEAGILAGMAIEAHAGTRFDENEIGYLSLHIGAAIERQKLKSGPKRCLIVCASGLGTAQLIYYKLKSKFTTEMDVVGTTEYYKLDNYNLNEIDFIVSSIPIPEELTVPVIEVNAILGDHDLEKINQFVMDSQKSITDLFQKDLLYLRKNIHTKEEALAFMHEQLVEKGLVDKTFLESIYEREQIAPTSFGNLVAVPHPITPKSEETFLAICTLDKPIEWGDKSVQFICVLSIKKNSTEDLQEMYDLLGNVIDSASMVQKLIKAKTYEEFIHVMMK